MKFRAIKVPEETYNRIREVVEKVSQQGWRGFGSMREGNICLGSIVDEAITQFQSRQKQRR